MLKLLMVLISFARCGKVREGWQFAYKAVNKYKFDPCVRQLYGILSNALVDRWHIPMLNDADRNKKFKIAIEKSVSQGYDNVLDIGAGTSLLRSVFRMLIKENYSTLPYKGKLNILDKLNS